MLLALFFGRDQVWTELSCCWTQRSVMTSEQLIWQPASDHGDLQGEKDGGKITLHTTSAAPSLLVNACCFRNIVFQNKKQSSGFEVVMSKKVILYAAFLQSLNLHFVELTHRHQFNHKFWVGKIGASNSSSTHTFTHFWIHATNLVWKIEKCSNKPATKCFLG